MKIAMMDAGLSAPTLAAKAGLSRSTIEKVMTNWRNPTAETKAKIEAALGVKIWSGPPPLQGAAASIAASESVDSNFARRLAKARFPFLSDRRKSTPKTELSLT